MPQAETATETAGGKKHRRDRGLLLVGVFKLTKAIFFSALAAGALKLVHVNIGDLAQNLVNRLHLSSGDRFVNMLLDRADLIGGHQLRQGALLSLGYAIVCVVEGVGLLMEKTWAEYLTIVVTTLGLPWESYELIEKYSQFKVGLMVLNVLVLVYLVWYVRRARARAASGVPAI